MYDLTIHDANQPLLVSQPKKREIRARGGDIGPVLLVPELCTRTGGLSRSIVGVNRKFTFHICSAIVECNQFHSFCKNSGESTV